MRTEAIKLLQEHIGINLDLGLGNDFLDITPNTQANKQKINILNQIWKLLCFKGQYQESEKTKGVAAVGNSLGAPRNVKCRITT